MNSVSGSTDTTQPPGRVKQAMSAATTAGSGTVTSRVRACTTSNEPDGSAVARRRRGGGGQGAWWSATPRTSSWSGRQRRRGGRRPARPASSTSSSGHLGQPLTRPGTPTSLAQDPRSRALPRARRARGGGGGDGEDPSRGGGGVDGQRLPRRGDSGYLLARVSCALRRASPRTEALGGAAAAAASGIKSGIEDGHEINSEVALPTATVWAIAMQRQCPSSVWCRRHAARPHRTRAQRGAPSMDLSRRFGWSGDASVIQRRQRHLRCKRSFQHQLKCVHALR